MLQIQRASAGSGKTYTLTKKFITHLIGKKTGGKWRLRNPSEILDVLPRILAITFTNKATNEMKERIVGKLSDLATVSDYRGNIEELYDKINYLEDFIDLFKVPANKIGDSCREALNCILNNYSLFHISTIDSFFQEILRTFAYEANLNDSYQLEIDADYIGKAALDTTLSEIDRRNYIGNQSSFWLRVIMAQEAEKSQRWNVFTKSDARGSLYKEIRDSVKRLEGEEYKSIKPILDKYFNDEARPDALLTFFSDFRKAAESERQTKYDALMKARERVMDLIGEKAIPSDHYNSKFKLQLEKIGRLNVSDNVVDFKYKFLTDAGSVFLKKFQGPQTKEIDEAAMTMYGILNDWVDPAKSPVTAYWNVFGPLIPYLGIIVEINSKMSKLLENDNTIRLSDTNALLKVIISDDETSYVYERLGNYIENYLIDEFQDTSKMQWEIIRPLIVNSIANGYDSLIIGDPKQSIYRFRNADHTLITNVVPDSFDHEALGMSPEENANRRSDELIVKFNNFFFDALARELTLISMEKGMAKDFTDLYRNVVQLPSNDNRKGYVEVSFVDAAETLNPDDDEEDPGYEELILKRVAELIYELIGRGYRQNEIAVLVNTNRQGKDVIESLIAFNDDLPEDSRKIDFISEESLLISSSPAVELIISVFEKLIAGGGRISSPQVESEEERNENEEEDTIARKKKIYWNKVKTNYYFFALHHPELDHAESVIAFLEDPDNDSLLGKMMESMQDPTLASILETVVDTFITDPEFRSSQAIYISALQDMLLEYCAAHSNDPASFLEWWHARGKYRSISSPEGIDAVQIMTIHKSKGLEFRCVIVPFANDSFLPSKNKEEWRWVDPIIPVDGLDYPPKLPIRTSKELMFTEYKDLYLDFIDRVITDKLNMFYVAFTRAVNELYIFSKLPKSQSPKINLYLSEILGNPEKSAPEFSHVDKITAADIEVEGEGAVFRIGRKSDPALATNEKAKSETTLKIIDDYYVNTKGPLIISEVSEMTSEEL